MTTTEHHIKTAFPTHRTIPPLQNNDHSATTISHLFPVAPANAASSPAHASTKTIKSETSTELESPHPHLNGLRLQKPRDLSVRLTPAEKQILLQWLEQHTYSHVIELAAQPTPIGLGKQLTRSTLSRFYRKHSLQLNKRRRLQTLRQAILPTAPQPQTERLTASILMEQLFHLASEPLDNLQELNTAATIFAKLSRASLQRDKLNYQQELPPPTLEEDLNQIQATFQQLEHLPIPSLPLEDDNEINNSHLFPVTPANQASSFEQRETPATNGKNAFKHSEKPASQASSPAQAVEATEEPTPSPEPESLKTPHPHLNGLRQEPTTPTQSTVTADSKISNPSPEIKTVAKPTAPTQSAAAATKESIALLRKEIHEKALLLGLRFENGKVRYCPESQTPVNK